MDSNGADWGVTRRNGESDDDYRNRILAIVPIYINGPTVASISQIVQNFTGAPPIILEYGPDSFTMGVSPMGNFILGAYDPFSFQIQVQNPNGVYYVEADMESSVNFAKPARSTVTFIHNNGHQYQLNGTYTLNGEITLG